MDETVNVESQDTESQATATAPEADTSQEAPETETNHETQHSSEDEVEQKQNPEKHSLPFSNGGKEKFKVDGKEVDWDWETTKRYAQKGYAGMKALQKASEIERKAKDFYGRLVQGAQQDPELLVRTLRGDPNWRFHPSGGQTISQDMGEPADPRDAKIRELEQKLTDVTGRFEQQDIAKEQQAISEELSAAEKTYPELKGDKFLIAYVKSEYAKALRNGMDVSIDDVAFTVAQEVKESRAQREQEKQKRFQQKRKQAPVTHVAGSDTGKQKPLSRDEILRMAGKIP